MVRRALIPDKPSAAPVCRASRSSLQEPVHILDSLGCCIAALGAGPVQACREHVAEFGGTVLGFQGKHAESIDCLQQALAIRVRTLGPDHPLVRLQDMRARLARG